MRPDPARDKTGPQSSLRQLLKQKSGFSAKRVNELIDAGQVTVNGKREMHGSRKLGPKDRIEWRDDAATAAPAASLKMGPGDILHVDEMLVACNKPAGFPSQTTADKSRPSVEAAMMDYWRSEYGEKLVLVHRLDRDTSGVLLFARNAGSAEELFAQFKRREIKKTYLALCHGILRREKGHWRHYLGRVADKAGRAMQGVVRSGGDEARTDWEVLGSSGGRSLWLLRPETGRTHQLRVQLAHAGFPIVGDDLYGTPAGEPGEVSRHMLHAWKVLLPGGLCIAAPLPADFCSELMRAGLDPAQLTGAS